MLDFLSKLCTYKYFFYCFVLDFKDKLTTSLHYDRAFTRMCNVFVQNKPGYTQRGFTSLTISLPMQPIPTMLKTVLAV